MGRGAAGTGQSDHRELWWALVALCSGVLMIAINVTIVNVAIPSIRLDLRFDDASVVWIPNAYLIPFASLLLLSGRFGDYFGNRRVFLTGVALFTIASLGGGFAVSQEMLVAARVGQGLGGAVVWAIALSQIGNLFEEPARRSRALGVCAFVCAAGHGLGLVLGGWLTSELGWSWIFLVNVPAGVIVYILCVAWLPKAAIGGGAARGRPDILGAMTITASLMLAVYAIVNARKVGWSTATTGVLLISALVLFMLFVAIESRVKAPLLPLGLYRSRNIVTASVSGALFSTAVLAWSFFTALYLQLVLRFDPMQVGLAFIPASLANSITSVVVAPILVRRFGVRLPIVVGLVMSGMGLVLIAQMRSDSAEPFDALPGMLLFGLGYGVAYNPLLLCALNSVAPGDSGAASGIVATAFTAGGTLGLSLLAGTVTDQTHGPVVSATDLSPAFGDSARLALHIAAACCAVSAAIGGVFLKREQRLPDCPADADGVIGDSVVAVEAVTVTEYPLRRQNRSSEEITR